MHEGHHHHHDHSHEGEQKGGMAQINAMLTYMLEHNRHHAQELRDLAEKLKAEGKDSAAKTLLEGAGHFDHGNEHLEETLDLIKEN